MAVVRAVGRAWRGDRRVVLAQNRKISENGMSGWRQEAAQRSGGLWLDGCDGAGIAGPLVEWAEPCLADFTINPQPFMLQAGTRRPGMRWR